MKIFDNISEIVRDDMADTIKKEARYRLQLPAFPCMRIRN